MIDYEQINEILAATDYESLRNIIVSDKTLEIVVDYINSYNEIVRNGAFDEGVQLTERKELIKKLYDKIDEGFDLKEHLSLVLHDFGEKSVETVRDDFFKLLAVEGISCHL